jgi:hypothetical protein
VSSAEDSFYPGKLWSLWDMQSVEIQSLFEACRVMTRWSNPHDENRQFGNADRRKSQTEIIRSYLQPLIDLGFSASATSLEKVAKVIERDDSTVGMVKVPANECLGRLLDEAKKLHFFSLTLREADFYKNPHKGWVELTPLDRTRGGLRLGGDILSG